MTKAAKEVLKGILERFESGDIPQAIAYSMFPIPDLPSSRWSFLNRIQMMLSGTADARGFRQWKEVNRYVRKGAKAIYILVPRIVKQVIEAEEAEEVGESEEKEILTGFMTRPVFKVEDTDGEPLDYEQMELPELPLIDRAREWGISVKAVPGNQRYYGYFSQANMEIGLATKEETVFFHELAHAAYHRIYPNPERENPWKEEIVAELSAAVLCKMAGKSSKYLGNNYRYIQRYAEAEKLSPVKACLGVLSDVELVLDSILAVGKHALPFNEPAPCHPHQTERASIMLRANPQKGTERGDRNGFIH